MVTMDGTSGTRPTKWISLEPRSSSRTYNVGSGFGMGKPPIERLPKLHPCSSGSVRVFVKDPAGSVSSAWVHVAIRAGSVTGSGAARRGAALMGFDAGCRTPHARAGLAAGGVRSRAGSGPGARSGRAAATAPWSHLCVYANGGEPRVEAGCDEDLAYQRRKLTLPRQANTVAGIAASTAWWSSVAPHGKACTRRRSRRTICNRALIR